jgi:hypothetical protein
VISTAKEFCRAVWKMPRIGFAKELEVVTAMPAAVSFVGWKEVPVRGTLSGDCRLIPGTSAYLSLTIPVDLPGKWCCRRYLDTTKVICGVASELDRLEAAASAPLPPAVAIPGTLPPAVRIETDPRKPELPGGFVSTTSTTEAAAAAAAAAAKAKLAADRAAQTSKLQAARAATSTGSSSVPLLIGLAVVVAGGVILWRMSK